MISNSVSRRLTSDWFGFPKPNPGAKVRLFCFPYAGSVANIYSGWASHLPKSAELCLVHLPGRGARLREKPFDRITELVKALETPLLPYLDKPMAFFGHSLGGLIVFEFSRHLRRRYGVEPAELFISGCGPRSMVVPPSSDKLAPDNLLAAARVINMRRMPSGVATADQLARLAIPTLKADLALMERYDYAEDEPLSCALSVYGGLQDPHVQFHCLEVWRKETTGPFALHLFRGDHFFIHTAEEQVLKALCEELGCLASRTV